MSLHQRGGFAATFAATLAATFAVAAATIAAGVGIAQADDTAVTPPSRSADTASVHSTSSTGPSARGVPGGGQKSWKGRPPTGICMYRPCRA